MNRDDMFKHMFKKDEGMYVGDFKGTRIRTQPNITNEDEFYGVNPMDPLHDHGFDQKPHYRQNKPRRADINVSAYRSFIFEIDRMHSTEDQLEVFTASGIPFIGITYSGGKSLHAVLALEEPLDLEPHCEESIQHYKMIWKRIAAHIDNTARDLFSIPDGVVDPSCKNPSRLTRIPGAIRSNGKEQRLLKLGSPISRSDFEALLEKCPEVKQSVIVDAEESDHLDLESVEDFLNVAPSGLRFDLKYPTWIDGEGNYPTLLRLALWSIDSTGVDRDIFTEVCERYVFPKFKESRYPRHKWYTAIEDAFNMKKR